MASGKEIRSKIGSVKNTQKITKAMEMVAASKMRRAQERMQSTRPYADKLRQVISHLSNAHPEYKHSFTQERDVKRAGYIVVSSDRGLCGGLNVNVFKEVLKAIKEDQSNGIEVDLCLIGSKAASFFKGVGGNVVASVADLGDKPHITDLIGAVKVMLDAFEDGKIDRLSLASNEFASAIAQKPTVAQLIPTVASEDESLKHHWDYIYEPEAKDVLDELMTRYIEGQVFQGVVENVACEQAARMMAMKNASDNAGTVIKELQLAYNKARQAAITQELSEIVAGAAAVS